MNKSDLKKRYEEVIKTNALVTNIDDFLVTHVPFKQLKYCESGITNDSITSYTEEDIFNKFVIENKERHNFVIVQGDNGSGKSHFIRWLKHKYDNENKDDSEVSIIIERENNTLQTTINQLLNDNLIKRCIGEEELKKLSQTNENIATEKFLTMIAMNFAAEVLHEEDDNCIIKSGKRKKLFAFLSNDIILKGLLTAEGGPIYRIGKKISNDEDVVNISDDSRFLEKDFRISQELMKSILKDDVRKVRSFVEDLIGEDERTRKLRMDVVNYLNSKLDKVIQESIKLTATDLKNMIDKLRVELKKAGKSLTLFIEDITSFSGIDKALIENLIHEHTEENGLCRLTSIVGITNAYYQDSFPDNLKERVTGRIIIDKESIFSDEKDVLNVAARYINAIYLDKKEIAYWIERGAEESELPLAGIEKEWASFTDERGRKFTLYPFNENAVIRLYRMLESDTPRMLIKQVLSPVFKLFSDETIEFPPAIEKLSASLKIPDFNKESYNADIDNEIKGKEKERVKSFLRIWGDGSIDFYEDNGVTYIAEINEEVFKEFDIPLISGNRVNTSLKKTGIVTQTNVGVRVAEKEKPKEDIKKDIQKENKTVISAAEIKINKEYENFKEDLRNWKDGRSLLKKHSAIRDYVLDFLKSSINWEMEGISSFAIEEVLTKSMICIEEQNVRITDSYIIEKNDENYYFFLTLVEYNILGNRKWQYNEAAKGIITVTKWLEKNKKAIIDFVKNYIAQDIDPYKYALVNNYYINSIVNKNGVKSSNLYEELLSLNIDINCDNIEAILGDKTVLFSKEDDIKENNNYVLRYYNCILGEANPRNTTVFYMDAEKILRRVNELKKLQWNLENELEIDISNKSEKLVLPYNLYKKLCVNTLDKVIEIRCKELIVIADKYREVISEETNINDLREEITNFFNKLRTAGIYYDSNIEKVFNKYFIENYIADEVINRIKEVEDKSVFDKINLLKRNISIYLNNYLACVKALLKLVNENYKKYSNISNKDKIDKLHAAEDELIRDIQELKQEISTVNGGDLNAVK